MTLTWSEETAPFLDGVVAILAVVGDNAHHEDSVGSDALLEEGVEGVRRVVGQGDPKYSLRSV